MPFCIGYFELDHVHTIIAPFLVLPYLHARDLYSDLNILKAIREEMEQNIPN